MSLLLDTHIFVWWNLNRAEMPGRYDDLLSDAEGKKGHLALSIVSFWEIAKLVQLRRFSLNISLDQWFQEIDENPMIQVLPLSSRIILESMRLGSSFPKDPMDQMIAATARCHDLRLVTVDDKIIKSGVVAIA